MNRLYPKDFTMIVTRNIEDSVRLEEIIKMLQYGALVLKKETLDETDFEVVDANINGTFVRLSELNELVEKGIIEIDNDKLKEYTFDNTVWYNQKLHTKEEAMKLWYNSK